MSPNLTVVVENAAAQPALIAEHGLAVHLSAGGHNIMFDTSATPQALAANAAALSVDLAAVEAVVISHGHPDHTGGLPALLRARQGLQVFACPGVFARRCSDRPGQARRQIGWQSSPQELGRQGAIFHPVHAAQELAEGVILSGPIGGPQPAIDHFLAETEAGLVRDEFADELFLMLRGRGGWTVLTGCCHRGLANTLSVAADLSGGKPIAAVMGGFHLGSAGPAELEAAAAAIRTVNPGAIYPCHCTGRQAAEYLGRQFPGKVQQVHGGTRLSI